MLNERKLTDTEIQKVNGIIKGMLQNKRSLVSKYGSEAEKVMYGRAISKVKKNTNMDIEKLNELIRSALKRPTIKNINESSTQEEGLIVRFRNFKDFNLAFKAFTDSDLYFTETNSNSIFFPEEEEYYDELEKLIQDVLDKYNLNGFIEGVWNESLKEEENQDKVDIISMDVPLFIRSLEYAREDAETDMDLHDFAEKAILGTKEKGVLTMGEYDELVGNVNEQEYTKDIEVQADKEEEYNELKQDLNKEDYKKLAESILKKLKENTTLPQKSELLAIQAKLVDILNQDPKNDVAGPYPNYTPFVNNGTVSFSLKLDKKNRMSDGYHIKVNLKDKEAIITFSGYVNNTSAGVKKETKTIPIGNGTLEQEVIKIVQDKSLWNSLSKEIHKQRQAYQDGYRSYMRQNPNDHS